MVIKNVQKIGNPWKRNRKNRKKHILYIFVHVHLAKIWWPNGKQEKTYFVHFCTFLYMYIWQKSGGQTGKNIFCTFLYMYIWQKSGGHVQKCSWTPPRNYVFYKNNQRKSLKIESYWMANLERLLYQSTKQDIYYCVLLCRSSFNFSITVGKRRVKDFLKILKTDPLGQPIKPNNMKSQ